LITQAIKLSVREVARWCHIRAENQHPKASGSAACSLDPMQMLGARSLRRAIANISQTYRWSIAADTGAQQLAGGSPPAVKGNSQSGLVHFMLYGSVSIDVERMERSVAGRGTACSCRPQPTCADCGRHLLLCRLSQVSVGTVCLLGPLFNLY
jgi:hypothetical protein